MGNPEEGLQAAEEGLWVAEEGLRSIEEVEETLHPEPAAGKYLGPFWQGLPQGGKPLDLEQTLILLVFIYTGGPGCSYWGREGH